MKVARGIQTTRSDCNYWAPLQAVAARGKFEVGIFALFFIGTSSCVLIILNEIIL